MKASSSRPPEIDAITSNLGMFIFDGRNSEMPMLALKVTGRMPTRKPASQPMPRFTP